jgi:peptide/nickel transport system substrate-binding protein/oligopeptide transport system substrate-binding protein
MQPRNTPLRRLWIVVLVSLGPALGACSSQPDQVGSRSWPAGTSPVQGGSFSLAQDSPSVLDPAQLDDSYEAAIVNQLFDGLLSYDDNLNTIPCLAESWTISEDGRRYTLRLKDGVRFHDGSDLSSEDVVYSLSRVFRLDPQRSVLAREYLAHIGGTEQYAGGDAATVEGLEAIDRLSVRISLEQPYTSFLSVLASEMARIVPKAYVERVGDEEFGRRPVGSGPFSFAEWKPEERIVLVRFPDYHAGAAPLDSIIFELPDVGHRDYAVSRFLEGKLCGIEVPPNRLEEFRKNPNIRIHARQELSLGYMALNLGKFPFDDPLVRQAFLLAADPKALCSLFEGGRLAPTGVLPPGMPGYDPAVKLPAHDLERARELLAQAGYPMGEDLPAIVHASANESESERQLHRELARQVAEAGFELITVYMNWLEFDRRIRRGEFDAFSLGWVADLPDPASFLDPLFHSAGSNNLHRYRNPEVDLLLEEGRRSRSNQRRWELYREAERLILSDAPIVPLYHAMSVIAVRARVRGFAITPLGIGNLNMERVWFDRRDSTPEVAR